MPKDQKFPPLQGKPDRRIEVQLFATNTPAPFPAQNRQPRRATMRTEGETAFHNAQHQSRDSKDICILKSGGDLEDRQNKMAEEAKRSGSYDRYVCPGMG